MNNIITFPPGARDWIYQSSSVFSVAQQEKLHEILRLFTQEWTAHNKQLSASYEIRYNLFIILKVDESKNDASGCSIDKTMHLMQQIEQQFGISLFDRWNLACKENGEVRTYTREQFEQLVANDKITANTIVFNNLVNTQAQLDKNWEVPLHKSWHAQFFSIGV